MTEEEVKEARADRRKAKGRQPAANETEDNEVKDVQEAPLKTRGKAKQKPQFENQETPIEPSTTQRQDTGGRNPRAEADAVTDVAEPTLAAPAPSMSARATRATRSGAKALASEAEADEADETAESGSTKPTTKGAAKAGKAKAGTVTEKQRRKRKGN